MSQQIYHFEGWTAHTTPAAPAPQRDESARASNRLLRMEQQLYAAYEANHHDGQLWDLADYRDADAALRPEIRQQLRSYARYEVANNPLVSRVVETYVDDLLGSPPPAVQVESGDSEVNRWIEDLWEQYCQQINLWGIIRTAMRAYAVDGEAFVLRSYTRLSTAIRVKPRGLEADRIAAPFRMLDHLEHYIDGIHLDPLTGEPVVYDVLETHPGSEYYDALPGGTRAFPVSADQMLHVFRALRPEQHRGVPDAAPILPLSGMFRKFLNGAVNKAALEAAFAYVLKSVAPGDDDNENEEDLWKRINFPQRQGLGMVLPDGLELQQLISNGHAQSVVEFQRAFAILYATIHRMPVGRAIGQYTTIGYAPIRAELKPYQNALDAVRLQILAPQLLTPVYLWFLREAVLLPEYQRRFAARLLEVRPQLHRWEFAPPELIVDPSREGEANRKDLMAGLALRSDWIHAGELRRRDQKAAREWGFDSVEEYLQQIARATFGQGAATPPALPSPTAESDSVADPATDREEP